MSTSQGISTISTKDHASNEDSTSITSSTLSVRLQASKFQQISKDDRKGLLTRVNKSKNDTALTKNDHRSPSNQLKNTLNRTQDEIIYTGSKKIGQTANSLSTPGNTHGQRQERPIYECKMTTKASENTNHDEILDSSTTDDDDDEVEYFQNNVHSDNDIRIKIGHLSSNNNERPKPGRLDLRQFDNITSAIARLNVQPQPKTLHKIPLASTDDMATNILRTTDKRNIKSSKKTEPGQQQSASDCTNTAHTPKTRRPLQNPRKNHGRPVAPPRLPTENAVSSSAPSHSNIILTLNQSFAIGSYQRTHSAEPNELINTRGETIRQLNEILSRPPTGRIGTTNKLGRTSSVEEQQRQLSNVSTSSLKKSEKESKKDKKRDEKLEKRKMKEEEKLKRQKMKLAGKTKPINDREKSVDDDGVPLFIKRCIEFIETEGLDAEGIYRVPGNRAHVDAFLQKFKDNPKMSIHESDIPVNAVATALKDFLSKKIGPIIPPDLMNELTELFAITASDQRASAVKDLVRRLPITNYNILRYVFSHFVRVSLNNTQNSMDSKNLAICWWPTLLPLQFNDMVMFERLRPHLEESIRIMIDQYDFIFDFKE